VDVIVSVTSQGVLEAKQAFAGVPVVIAVGVYPVERGFIASLNRPGGNMTGIATFTAETYAKRLQIVTETLPGVSRVAVLRLSTVTNDLIVRDLKIAADQFRLRLQMLSVQRPDDFSAAFQAAVRGQAQAIMTTQGPFSSSICARSPNWRSSTSCRVSPASRVRRRPAWW
jgi:putative ABC transport system substrate-binding protein